jgi:competence protein ComEC
MGLTMGMGLLAGVLAALGAWCEGMRVTPAWLPWLLALATLALALPVRTRPLAALCTGLLWAGAALRDYGLGSLPPAFDERVLVEARVAGIPERRGATERFTAYLAPLRPGSGLRPGMLASLRWDDAPALHAGDTWQLTVGLHAPPTAANPGSGDTALLALRLRLQGAGQVIASPLNQRTSMRCCTLDRLRERLGAWMARRVPERDAAALIVALAVGDTQRVSVEQWRIFNAVGITHLVAISGLHVTLFSLVAGWCAAQAWRRWRWLQSRCARGSCSALVGVTAAAGYALLAGWSVPTQRTLLMLAAWHGLALLARPRRATTTLAAGLTGVLWLDPLSPLSAGFWLSFLAVAALLLGSAVGPPAAGGWRGMLREQAWVGVALLPVTIAVFGSLSLAGLVVNLAAIPFFSFLLVPLVLAATACTAVLPGLAGLLLQGAAACVQGAWPLLEAAANLRYALWRAEPGPAWFLLAAAALAVVLLPWPRWMRASAALALVPLAAPASTPLPAGSFAATTFDLGSGEATLVRTTHHALLFDDGEVHGSGGAVAARVLVPALRHYGLSRLDRVLLPRMDGDRGDGVAALDAALAQPAALWAAPRTRSRSRGSAHGEGAAADDPGEGSVEGQGAELELPQEFRACAAGEHWRWDGVDFELLAGEGCSLRISSGASALLLPGPIAAARQRLLLARVQGTTPVLLVPGQGARSAWSPALAAAARPQWVILAGTPRTAARPAQAATLAAWCATGARALLTGQSGAVELAFSPSGAIRIATRRRAWVSCPIGSAAE